MPMYNLIKGMAIIIREHQEFGGDITEMSQMIFQQILNYSRWK